MGVSSRADKWVALAIAILLWALTWPQILPPDVDVPPCPMMALIAAFGALALYLLHRDSGKERAARRLAPPTMQPSDAIPTALAEIAAILRECAFPGHRWQDYEELRALACSRDPVQRLCFAKAIRDDPVYWPVFDASDEAAGDPGHSARLRIAFVRLAEECERAGLGPPLSRVYWTAAGRGGG